MGRKAEPSEKNIYYRSREKVKGLSREKAAEKIGISSTTLGRIELGHIAPKPDDVVAMVELYGEPSLYNYYCSNDCKIGMDCSIDEVKPVSLAEATLGILSSVNAFNKWKDKFIDIAMDGDVDDDEKDEFKSICKALGEISTMVERLKLTVETSKFSKTKNS